MFVIMFTKKTLYTTKQIKKPTINNGKIKVGGNKKKKKKALE